MCRVGDKNIRLWDSSSKTSPSGGLYRPTVPLYWFHFTSSTVMGMIPIDHFTYLGVFINMQSEFDKTMIHFVQLTSLKKENCTSC